MISSQTKQLLIIREAELADLPALQALEFQIFRKDAYDTDQLRALISAQSFRPATGVKSRTIFLVACISKHLVGLTIGQVLPTMEFSSRYHIDADLLLECVEGTHWIAYLKEIAIESCSRRLGLGTALDAARSAFFSSIDVRHQLLLQMPVPGLSEFHSKLGFQRVPLTTTKRYSDGSAATLWYRRLA